MRLNRSGLSRLVISVALLFVLMLTNISGVAIAQTNVQVMAGEQSTGGASTDGNQSYANQVISFDYPVGWEVSSEGPFANVMLANENGGVIVIMSEPSSKVYTANEIYDHEKEGLTKEFKDISDPQSIKLGDLEALTVTASTYKDKEIKMNLVLAASGKHIYVISLSTEKDLFDNDMKAIDILLSTFKVSDAPELTTVSEKTYVFDDFYYSLEYPENWAEQETLTGYITFYANSWNGSRILISEEPLNLDVTAEEYVELSKQGLNNLGAQDVKTESTTLDGGEAVSIQYKLIKDDEEYRILTVATISDGYAYCITYQAYSDQYEAEYGAMQKVLSTFKFYQEEE
ncbi:MAG: hypothetical protein ACYCX4_04855, partial [Bacillota bacterium]